MELDLVITPGSGAPIFRQIVDQVRLAAATGRLAENSPLPSVRALAERLLINPNTVAKAYAELARERVIETQQGRGVFIAPPRQMYTKIERRRRLEPLVTALANEGVSLGFSTDELIDALRQKLESLPRPHAQAEEPAGSKRSSS
jgi:GntR family transcriptional regulator